MQPMKKRVQRFRSRLQTVTHTLSKGPLGWGVILLALALFYLFFFFTVRQGMTMEQLLPISSWSLLPLLLGAWLKGRRGGFLAWFLAIPNLIIAGNIAYGAAWFSPTHRGEVIVFMIADLGIGQAAGLFSAINSRLSSAYATIQKQALTDALTGLPNHRAVMDQLEKELDRARRFDRPFSLLFFDADRFKHVNDTYGHGTGDAVLRQIGERVGSLSCGGETLGRFGGEEFVLLLPEADASEASAVAERIRAAIAARPMATEEVTDGILMSVSMGVATYPADGEEGKALLSQADEAMYLAKRLGRNQVRTAAEGRLASANPELQLLLQEAERGEALERQGQSPQQIKEGYMLKMISSLLFLVEQRDPSMHEHSQRVSTLATAIAQELALEPSEVFKIGSAALLHDVGKVGLPDVLLEKAGPLSPDERELLKEHPQLGAQILQTNPFLHDLMPIVLHHHERWDGTGYPDHLAGELIPLAARIIAVAESYDTMLRGFSYQVSHSPEEAIAELQRGAGTQFDPRIVQCFLVALTHQQEPQAIPQVVG
jgi:two-component system cell cycle response regulator